MTAAEMPSAAGATDLGRAPLEEVLAALRVDVQTGLSDAEAEARLRQYGSNEVPEQKPQPLREFLKKFWGLSAWMLELIIVVSWVLGKYADLVIVSALLMVNAIVSLVQERRASGETPRSRVLAGPRRMRDLRRTILKILDPPRLGYPQPYSSCQSPPAIAGWVRRRAHEKILIPASPGPHDASRYYAARDARDGRDEPIEPSRQDAMSVEPPDAGGGPGLLCRTHVMHDLARIHRTLRVPPSRAAGQTEQRPGRRTT